MAGDVEAVSGAAAFALVGAPAVVLLMIAAGFGVLRRSLRRQAMTERASLQVDAFALREGRIALSGTVEILDGDVDSAPVTASLDGKIESRPFLLRLENGVRLRVEPGARPRLLDAHEGPRASLTAGERVFVRGVLKTPISAAPHAAHSVMGPPRWGRVLLSTEAFSGELDRRASGLGFQTAMLVITAIASQLF